MTLELYGTRSCPYTAELRAELDWQGRAYVEYDVEADASARSRLQLLLSGVCSVPVLVDDGRVVQLGYEGRSCYLGAPE
jgi:mycoredoxin